MFFFTTGMVARASVQRAGTVPVDLKRGLHGTGRRPASPPLLMRLVWVGAIDSLRQKMASRLGKAVLTHARVLSTVKEQDCEYC